MNRRACAKLPRKCCDTAREALTTLLMQLPRNKEWQVYPLDTTLGAPCIHHRHKGIQQIHIISLLYELSALRMKDGSLCINNKVIDNLALILTDTSIDVMINQQRLNSYTYVNVKVKDVKASRRSRSPKQGTTLDDTTMRDVLDKITFKFKRTVMPQLRDPQVGKPQTRSTATIKLTEMQACHHWLALLPGSSAKALLESPPPLTTAPSAQQQQSTTCTAAVLVSPPTSPMIATVVEAISTKYPMLEQFKIPTDFNNPETKQTINAILRELEQLGKNNDLRFVRHNNTRANAFFIPGQITTKKSFQIWAKKKGGMKDMLEYMSNDKVGQQTNEPTSVEYITEYLLNQYPNTVTAVMNVNGLSLIDRMNEIETAALLSDVGVADKKVLRTLQRHLKVKLDGDYIFAKSKDLATLTSRLPRLTCTKISFEKEEGKKKETVWMSSVHISDVIAVDMDRYLESMVLSTNNMFETRPEEPLYQYKIGPDNLQGIYVMMGTDHGQGAAQFMLNMNLGSSDNRKAAGRCDFETRSIPFATIKCKKDPYEILNLTSELTNEGINNMSTMQLVALTNAQTVRTIWIDKSACEFTIQNDTFVATGPNFRQTFPIPINLLVGQHPTIRFKVIIKNIKILQIGDLAAQMALQGREGYASSRCIKCDLTNTQWKSGRIGGNLLTLQMLTTDALAIHLGQKRPMLWRHCPLNSVTPILHCQLGTVNDQLFKMLFRQLLAIECTSVGELEGNLKVLDLEVTIAQQVSRRDELQMHLQMQQSIHTPRRKELIKHRAACRRTLRTQNQQRIEQAASEIARLATQIDRIDAAIKSIKTNVAQLKASISANKEALRKVRSEMRDLAWERRKDEVSIITKVERILEAHGVKIQAYHGGTLTGGAIIALLNQNEQIMDQITTIAMDAIAQRENDTFPLRPPSVADMNAKLLLHRKLFQAQDAMYAHLRLIKPSTREKRETRERISVMKILWHEMGLSETPKAHLIFAHAADDQERFDGIGDKIEDPLEKRHQEQMRIDHIVSKMHGGFEARMRTQQKYEWRNNHPLVVEQINKIVRLTSRKREHDNLSKGEERIIRCKTERDDLRTRNMEVIAVELN